MNVELSRLIADSESYTSLSPFSILYKFTDNWFVWSFFLLAIIPYSLFMVGYRSKLMGLISLFFLWNIQHRTSIVIETDDRMLLSLLFFSLFLPLDNYLSLKKTNLKVSWAASWAIILQIAVIYFCNGFPKTGDAWTSGYAMELAMQEDLWINKTYASWILNYPRLCEWISLGTKPFEIALALIILIPFKTGRFVRGVAGILMICFHLGINVFLSFGFLPLIASAWGILLIPSSFWRKLKLNPTKEYTENSYFLDNFSLPIMLLFSWQAMSTFPWALELNPILPKAISNTSLTQQKWILYAPNVNSEIGWYQLKGLDKNNDNIEVRSGENWDENGSNTKAYQYECWQNFNQYMLYNQPYSDVVMTRWLEWECKENELKQVELYNFKRSIYHQRDTSVVNVFKSQPLLCSGAEL